MISGFPEFWINALSGSKEVPMGRAVKVTRTDIELRPCSRTSGCFTPVHERNIEWDNTAKQAFEEMTWKIAA